MISYIGSRCFGACVKLKSNGSLIKSRKNISSNEITNSSLFSCVAGRDQRENDVKNVFFFVAVTVEDRIVCLLNYVVFCFKCFLNMLSCARRRCIFFSQNNIEINKKSVLIIRW